MIPISEIFGPTIQGEGPRTGYPTIFVRVYGCNLDCPWCDTKYAIQGGENSKLTVQDIVDRIVMQDAYNCKDVTFTGGEPLLYNELFDVIRKLYDEDPDYRFHFETNGTKFPDQYAGLIDCAGVSFVVSPKLHAIDDKYVESLKRFVSYFCDISLKFVYESPDTITQIKQLLDKLPYVVGIPIYLMPEGIKFDQAKYEETVEACIKNGYIMSSRLHNIIWGNKRGV